MKTINGIAGAPAPVGAYSQAVVSGNLVFCSGQIGINSETGSMVDGGIEVQAAQVFQNVAAVLAGAGSSKDKIVMTSLFLAEISDGPAVNKIYADFINDDSVPARQTFAVKDLPLGALVEVSVVAELS